MTLIEDCQSRGEKARKEGAANDHVEFIKLIFNSLSTNYFSFIIMVWNHSKPAETTYIFQVSLCRWFFHRLALYMRHGHWRFSKTCQLLIPILGGWLSRMSCWLTFHIENRPKIRHHSIYILLTWLSLSGDVSWPDMSLLSKSDFVFFRRHYTWVLIAADVCALTLLHYCFASRF